MFIVEPPKEHLKKKKQLVEQYMMNVPSVTIKTTTMNHRKQHILFAIKSAPFWRRKWQPLQYLCLENLTDRGAWWATVHEVAKKLGTT